jgi:hypothetical protein
VPESACMGGPCCSSQCGPVNKLWYPLRVGIRHGGMVLRKPSRNGVWHAGVEIGYRPRHAPENFRVFVGISSWWRPEAGLSQSCSARGERDGVCQTAPGASDASLPLAFSSSG